MPTFILAITTYNRLDFLSNCITSWDKTKTKEANWELVIADDGSEDGTIEYVESLKLENTKITLLKNNRIGVHQQMNTIIELLEVKEFDFCFKIDDDIKFLKSGWDMLYYDHYLKTGQDHLVFFEKKWEKKQHLKNKVNSDKGEGNVSLLNVHGFFYTLTKDIVKKVGYFDYREFYFRGMGHVDYTARCCRAGFNNIHTPFDVKNSNEFISAYHEEYASAIKHDWVSYYDEYFRKKKVDKILEEDRVYIGKSEVNLKAYFLFKDRLINAMAAKLNKFEKEKAEIVNWYENQYNDIPKWYLKLGKIFKLKLRMKKGLIK